jgi:hypothetical protein
MQRGSCSSFTTRAYKVPKNSAMTADAIRPELLALPDPIEHTVEAHNAWIVSSPRL